MVGQINEGIVNKQLCISIHKTFVDANKEEKKNLPDCKVIEKQSILHLKVKYLKLYQVWIGLVQTC